MIREKIVFFKSAMGMFFSFLLIFIGGFIIITNIFASDITSEREQSRYLVEKLEESITIVNGELNDIPSVSFLLGNTELLVLVDSSNNYTKEQLLNDLKEHKKPYGIYIGKNQVVYKTKIGFNELKYSDIESIDNIITGKELGNVLNLNNYLYENVGEYMIQITLYFLILLLVCSFLIIMFILNYKKLKRNIENSNTEL